MGLLSLIRRGRYERVGFELYGAAVAAARDPFLYTALRVPDTLDGRFDMIGLHTFLLIQRLKREPAPGPALAQAVFDAMFSDMDINLREMGVGDLSVGRKVRVMWEAFHGRAAAYADGHEWRATWPRWMQRSSAMSGAANRRRTTASSGASAPRAGAGSPSLDRRSLEALAPGHGALSVRSGGEPMTSRTVPPDCAVENRREGPHRRRAGDPGGMRGGRRPDGTARHPVPGVSLRTEP